MLGFGSKNVRPQSRKRLGEFLIEQGCLRPEDLKKALTQQNREGGLLGDILVKSNLVGRDVLLAYLLKLHGQDLVGLLDYHINEQAVNQIPEAHCLQYCMLPIDKLGRILTVAMVDPLDTEALNEARQYCRDLRFRPVPCTWEDFQAVAKRIFNKDIQKPADLEDRYRHLDTVSLAAAPASKATAPIAFDDGLDLNEDPDVQPLARDVDDVQVEGTVFETPDFDDGASSPGFPHGTNVSPGLVVTTADFSAGIQELAEAIRSSIENTLVAIAPVPTAPEQGGEFVSAEQITSAVREALEYTVSAFSEELRHERQLLLDQLRTPPPEPGPAPAAVAEMIGDRVGATMQQALETIAGQLQQVGSAIQKQAASGEKQTPPAEIAAALQTAVAEATRQSAAAMTDTLLELLTPRSETPQSPDPLKLAEMIRDGVGTVMGNAMETMAEQIQALAEAQRQQISALPPPTDFHAAARELQEHLTAGLDARLNLVADHLQTLAQRNDAASSEHIGRLAETLRESILAAIAASEKAQAAQREAFAAAMRENLSAVVSASGEAQAAQQETFAAAMRESLAAAVSAGGQAQAAQREEFAAVIRESLVAAIATGGEAQAAQQERLAQVVEATLSALAADKDGQEGELARIAEAMLRSMEQDKAAQSEKQDQLAQIARAALESVRQTTQLIEAHTVAENSRNDLLRRRQSQHASVTPFNPEATVNPEHYAEEDSRVRDGLDSERPLTSLTFANFFPGEANAFTVKLAAAVAQEPGAEYNPLFLYGAVGLGKTHLISAIGNEILARPSGGRKQPPPRVGYISASQFARRLATAAADDSLELFRDNYCHWDVLILDDIQFLGGRVEAQEEFFHIFNVLLQSGRQIIIAGDKPPDRLGLLEQRLVSRFASGIVAEVKPPEWETRMKILRHIVEQSKIKIPEDILSLIALRVADDIRKMTGALRKIIAYARLQDNKVSMEEAQNILSHLKAHEAA